MPRGAGDRLLLGLSKHRAGLNEMHSTAKADGVQDPKGVARERSPPRPKFGIQSVFGRASPLPAIREGRADELAEHLADFRCRREITGRAQWVTRRVITIVARFHIG